MAEAATGGGLPGHMMRAVRAGADPAAGDEDERAAAFELLRRFGVTPGAFFIRYDAPWRYFFTPGVEGVVVYVASNGTAVAWSDPLCAPDDGPALLKEFIDGMRDQGLQACLLAVSERVARLAMSNGAAALKIGEEPVFDLTTWQQPRGDPGKKLRWGLNKGRPCERGGARLPAGCDTAAGGRGRTHGGPGSVGGRAGPAHRSFLPPPGAPGGSRGEAHLRGAPPGGRRGARTDRGRS